METDTNEINLPGPQYPSLEIETDDPERDRLGRIRATIRTAAKGIDRVDDWEMIQLARVRIGDARQSTPWYAIDIDRDHSLNDAGLWMTLCDIDAAGGPKPVRQWVPMHAIMSIQPLLYPPGYLAAQEQADLRDAAGDAQAEQAANADLPPF